mmetsp:Transcript_108323/g.170838  ORF Transcript_108323/g.170838 Transcript_108323/m.170838 type:complete len:374 (-) Transcript_108323:63-1184(-)
MAAAFYETHVQRLQSYAVPSTGNLLGSCARMGSSYQLPSAGHQLNSGSYVTPPTSLNAGSSLLPNGGNHISSCFQLPSTGNIGGIGFNNFISSVGSTNKSQYSVNQEVDIYSESSKGWVGGVITKIGDNGTATVRYNGNQKLVPIEHQHTHLRPSASRNNQPRTTLGNPIQPNWFGGASKFDFFAPGGDGFHPGTEVEYYSTTHCGWVQAKIMRVRPDGNYDLDCKCDVPAAKLRLADQTPSLIEGGICDAAPPQRVAPSYDKYGPPPPTQVGTFQFDLAALCSGAPSQPGFANNAPPPCGNYDNPQDYGAPDTFYDNDAPYQNEPSFVIDLAQAVKDVEAGDQYGNAPRRVETEYLPYGNGPRRSETEYLPW